MDEGQNRKHGNSPRRLAAILFADIVGYTSLMQQDEQRALQTIQHYQHILSTTADQFNGQILKNYGDGSLMIFQNSLEAVQAAKEIQDNCNGEILIPLRIGIHVGEFVVRNNDIYGNGVNLASRLESLGVAGSVLFSSDVYRKIKNHPELKAKSLGSFEFKNVEEPMEVFALVNEGFVVPKREEMKGKLKAPTASKLSNRLVWLVPLAIVLLGLFYFLGIRSGQKNTTLSGIPKIAVLEFNTAGNAENKELSIGITKELIQRLSGLKNLGVISYQSVVSFVETSKTLKEIGLALDVDYVMGGTANWSSQNDGSSLITIAPELLRVSDNEVIWSDEYQQKSSGSTSLQTEFTNALLKQLDVVLTSDELFLLRTAPTENSLAYQAYLKGLRVRPPSHGSEKDFRTAFRMFQQAVQLDPNFVQANLQLGLCYMDLHWFGYENSPAAMDSALHYFKKVQQIDPDLKEVAYYMGDYYYRLREYDKSLAEFSKIIDDRPNDTNLLQRIGELWRRQGLFDQALETLEKGLRLDPYNANSITELAWTYIFVSNFPRALELNERGKLVDPEGEWNYMMGAFIHWNRGEEGDLEKAGKLLGNIPDPRSEYPANFWILQRFFENNPSEVLRLIAQLSAPAVVLQHSYEPKELIRGLAYLQMGEKQKAKKELESAIGILAEEVNTNPEDFRMHIALGLAYAGLGEKDKAIAAGKEATRLLPLEKDALMGLDVLYGLMKIYGLLGEDDLALDVMTQMLAAPTQYHGILFTHNPTFAQLQSNPRFLDSCVARN